MRRPPTEEFTELIGEVTGQPVETLALS